MSTTSKITNRLTRMGFHFLFLGAFAVFGGAFRGFNLLLVLSGMLIGAMLLQWRWSRRNISSITIRRRSPTHVHADQSFRVRFRLFNHNRFLPSWMIGVKDCIESITGHEYETAGCGVASISARSSSSAYYDCLIARRGRYRLGPVSIETTFPFSLFRCRKTFDESVEICVFPGLLQLRRHWQAEITSQQDGRSSSAKRTGSTDGEFFGLREWQNGDSPKWIHWRTSARLQQPAVRQFEQRRRFDICIVVDAYAPDYAIDHDAETAISLAATILMKLSDSSSNQIALTIAGAEQHAIVATGSGSNRFQMLSMLAGIKVDERGDVAAAIQQAMRMAGSTEHPIVISSRSQQEAFAGRDQATILRSDGRRRPMLRWIDVRDKEVSRLIVEPKA